MAANPPQISTVKGTLPQDSTPFERRQNTLRQLHNRKVYEVFADVVDARTDGVPYDPSKVTPENSARRIMRADVIINDGDSFADMWLKTELIKYMDDPDSSVILPTYDSNSVSVTDKPHVHLFFIERKSSAIIANRRRAEALISFRLTDKTITTVTQTDLDELKREINLAFPSSYQLKKGKFKYSYRDKANGYELILAMLNESEAREVITKVLSIRDKTPDFEEFLTTSSSEKNFTIKRTIRILNQTEKVPLERPVADCYLCRAYVSFGKLKTVNLLTRQV